MTGSKTAKHFIGLVIISAVALGCRFFPIDRSPEVKETPKTKITKELLEQRLGAKGVKITTEIQSGKPNPYTLHLVFANDNHSYLLNRESCGYFGELAMKLKEIFRQRDENGIFIEGTNTIYKKLTLPAYQKTIDDYNSKNISVEDFEKLVEDLRKEGFDQIELDLKEENSSIIPDIPTKMPERIKVKDESGSDASSNKLKDIKTISGGVVNGKATNLVKPPYPPAAKAVRASGAVNVQVTIDENGDVVSASAVSGHPLLRSAAVQAAKSSKFAPTLLSGKPVQVTGVIVYNFTPE